MIRTRTNEYVEGTSLELDCKEKAVVVEHDLLHIADMEIRIGIEVLRTADTATEEEEGSNRSKLLAMAAAAMRCCRHRPNVRSTS